MLHFWVLGVLGGGGRFDSWGESCVQGPLYDEILLKSFIKSVAILLRKFRLEKSTRF